MALVWDIFLKWLNCARLAVVDFVSTGDLGAWVWWNKCMRSYEVDEELMKMHWCSSFWCVESGNDVKIKFECCIVLVYTIWHKLDVVLVLVCHFQSVKKVFNKLKGLLHIILVRMYWNNWFVIQSTDFT